MIMESTVIFYWSDKSSHKILKLSNGFSQNSYRTSGSTLYRSIKYKYSLNPFTIRMKSSLNPTNPELTTKKSSSLFQGLGRTANELERILVVSAFEIFQSETNTWRDFLQSSSFCKIRWESLCKSFCCWTPTIRIGWARPRQAAASELIRRVENELQKNRHKLKKQEKELLATDNAEEISSKELTTSSTST